MAIVADFWATEVSVIANELPVEQLISTIAQAEIKPISDNRMACPPYVRRLSFMTTLCYSKTD
ncbi:MAG: hypothetical protein RBQ79_06190 [Sphaerochaetaceae bacterium]|nr:hypothetical protein [Sphaerochaetaceae bacterium]